jgi:site-specific DNA-methyltransferase (adenine-specific)
MVGACRSYAPGPYRRRSKAASKGKKGADKGIDGIITFVDDTTGKPKRIIVQVKSGKVSSRDVRDLRGAVKREKAAIAILITLEEPTQRYGN